MKNITMLTSANLRKNKSQAVSLMAFVLLAVMLLNVGLVLLFNFDKHLDDRANQLHTPHLSILQREQYTNAKQLDWLKGYPCVTETEKLPVLADYGEYYMHGAKNVAVLIFEKASETDPMNAVHFIGESRPLDDNSIYVPYVMKVAGGHQLGEDYRLNFEGKELHFTIAGFTEEITFGALMNDLYRFYISDEAYARLSAQFPDSGCWLQTARLENSALGIKAQVDYEKRFYHSNEMENISSPFVFAVSFASVKEARLTISITAMLITAFSLILLLVSLIIIRFGIISNIEESMVGIGTLKAVGYRNRQIMLSIMLQFGSITLVGGLLGGAAAVALLPGISKLLESQTALIWNPGFDFSLAIIALFLILLLVLFVSFWAAKRIYKLHPLIALRGGYTTHSFKKNRMSLENTHGPLPMLLAMKQLLQRKRQAFMITFLVAVMSFASVVGMSVYYNISVKPERFLAIVAGEQADVGFVLKDRTKTESIVNKLQKYPEVHKAFEYQHAALTVNNIGVSTYVTKDWQLREGDILTQGRFPKHDNEVAVGNRFAEVLGKEIGDTVTVTTGGQSKEFIITGFIQIMSGGGLNMAITYDGILTLRPDFTFDQLCVYLEDGTDTNAFIQKVKDTEGNIFSYSIDIEDLIAAQFSQLGSVFAAVAAGMFTITAVLVMLILYIVIKTMILRNKKGLGIQKAVGFTTFQLMNQTTVQYVPLILLGAAIGGAGGYFSLNPILTAFMRGAGIVKTNLPSPTAWTILTCIALVGLAYLVSMLIAWRIRKISPYSLISE